MRVSIRSDTCLALRLIATQEHYRKTQDWLAMLPELQQRTSTIVQSQSIIETQAAEILRLRAENEKLRAAGEGVVKWWLEGGSMRLEGAPYCMFALRRALDGERAAAALKETGDDG